MSSDGRPNPDQLLARVEAEEAKSRRGKLKIFFGAAPGVGKTFAMLEAGRKAAKEGVDVVVGYLEPHARPETQALALGLDVLPRKQVPYRGQTLLEFDLAAALTRRPALLLVDELAHTNAPGLLHAKRYQDVLDLLEAGIDVYSTVNVQHLESLNDLVARITGVVVRETIPDSVFDQADEIALVDIAPDDLIERLRDGKVYIAQQAQRAIKNYFSKGNLIALRELALRRSAERVEAQMDDFRKAHSISRIMPASERLLVCVTASPSAPRLVRATKRMATALRAQWHAVYVETPAHAQPSGEDRDRLAQTLHLAEQLGGEPAMLFGVDVVTELLRFASESNATKIIVGKPHQPRWKELLRGSFVNELARRLGDIDLYVISGDADARLRAMPAGARPRASWRGYLLASALMSVVTALGFELSGRLQAINLVMLYLLALVLVAVLWGHGPAVLATVASVAAFDFFFIAPYWTFAVSDTEYLITFGVMLVTGLTISTLTNRVRVQAQAAGQRERRTAALFSMSRDLLNASSALQTAATAAHHISATFDGEVFLLIPKPRKPMRPVELEVMLPIGTPPQPLADHDLAVASWAFENGEVAGRGTDTLPSADTTFFPLRANDQCVGLLGLRPAKLGAFMGADQRRLLETFAGQLALNLERIQAAEAADRAQVAIATERLRNSLLSAVSHDLRTPLATIMGASSALVDRGDSMAPANRRELSASIYSETERLNSFIANLLEMTRLEAGAMAPRREWHSIEESIGVVLSRFTRQLADRLVTTHVDPDLPLALFDELLIQQVLANLVENAIKYSPKSTPIDISASATENELVVEVADRGKGISTEEAAKIFDKFYRAPSVVRRAGAGLGLAVCRGIVELHGGRIWAENRVGNGAALRFSIPRGKAPDTPRDSVTDDLSNQS